MKRVFTFFIGMLTTLTNIETSEEWRQSVHGISYILTLARGFD